MRHVAFFHKATGRLHPVAVMGSDDRVIEANTPPDHIAIDQPAGIALDHRTQAVDVTTGAVIQIDAPPVSAQDEDERRRAAVVADICRLERAQHRAVREAVLSGNAARLREIDAEIAALRNELK